ncbi:cell-to-cell movement protein [Tobacco mottle virus]|uniref:Cell-to-cell movement protein n=1 Tax=Tobacco mottle virus TaxID=136138 RepID=Q9DX75_9TOMB|nr:cell-to-cell movement protein [Tobacco mottle virus]AAG02573.1 cell-to-cell movement protein [Tobacco mottle virus]
MSTSIVRADCKQELLDALYGEVTTKELQESNLGVLTPVRGSARVTLTPLLPPDTQSRLSKVLRKYRPTRHTGGMLFIERVVIVLTPHVPDDYPGAVEVYIHDNLLPNLNSMGERVRVELNGGPKLMAFYPHYSIPLSDMVGIRPRSFCVVSSLVESTLGTSGASLFSMYLMWHPNVESRSHNYLPQSPRLHPVCRHRVQQTLHLLDHRQKYLSGAMSNRFALPVMGTNTSATEEDGVETDHAIEVSGSNGLGKS